MPPIHPHRLLASAILTFSWLTAASTSHGATPEVRGTWITTTGLGSSNSTIQTPAKTTTSFNQLRNIGFNTVYVDAWRNGATYFPSTTMQQTTGVLKAGELGSRDLLSETLIQAHRNGMTHMPWFQYGLAAKFGNPGTSSTDLGKYMADRGWLLKDQAGAYTNASNGFSWMNPAVPEVRQFMINIVLEAVNKYDVDGVHFDDRLAWPAQFGFDDTTRAIYLAETGRNLPASHTDTHFSNWRSGKVKLFAQELNSAVKAARPSVLVSVSPSVYPFSYNNYLANWPDWNSSGLFDEFIPQVYRSTFSDFDRDWDGTNSTTGGQVQYMGSRRGDFAGGIAINLSSGPNTWTTVQSSLNLVRNTSGVSGHSLWFSEGVLNLYASNLTGYYNVAGLGQAPRPDLGADWRPAPTVATVNPGDNTEWLANLAQSGRYRLIARNGDTWTELLSSIFPAGSNVFDVVNASQVELLVDRRPYFMGDANLDGLVDMTDLTALVNHWKMTNEGWIGGDFNLDGIVDLRDLSILGDNWNSGVSASNLSFAQALAMVPEPSTLVLALAVCGRLLHRGRKRA